MVGLGEGSFSAIVQGMRSRGGGRKGSLELEVIGSLMGGWAGM